MTRSCSLLLLLCFLVTTAGCRVHMVQVRENNVISPDRFDAIALGSDRRTDILNQLGPPDEAFFGPSILVFDYRWQRHRGTATRFFLPSEVIPGLDPLFILGVMRYFFDPSEEPEVFRPTLAERVGQSLTRLITIFIPFSDGQDLVTLSGRQLRHDRLRVVFDRQNLVVQGKSLRYASGEYRDESLASRMILRAD